MSPALRIDHPTPEAPAGAEGLLAQTVPLDTLRHLLDEVQAGRLEAAEEALRGLLGEPGPVLSGVVPLQRFAVRAAREMAWEHAELAYAILVARGRMEFASRRDRMQALAADRPEFEATFVGQQAITRLAPWLAARTGRRVIAIRSERLAEGTASPAVFRHRIRFADAPEEASFVEKVFSERLGGRGQVIAMDRLFAAIPPASLLAAPYLGTFRAGSFDSALFGFCDGTPVVDTAWPAFHRELLYRYWCVAPPAALLAQPPMKRATLQLAKRLADGTLPRPMLAQMPDGLMARAQPVVAGLLPALTDLAAALPAFVLHVDLHRNNVLVGADERLAVVDWDVCELAPIGFGWPAVGRDGTVASIDPARISWLRRLPPQADARGLTLLAMLWQWQNHAGRRHPADAARVLEALLRHA